MFLLGNETSCGSSLVRCLLLSMIDVWCRLMRLSIITGVDYCNELLEWITELTFFALKIILMATNEISLIMPIISCQPS